MSRVIGGVVGGRRLRVPPGPGTRPTTDRVREALFSRLEHDGWLPGTRFLDLFAGSGALGMEAASRGAAVVTFVESHPGAARTITENIHELGLAKIADLAVDRRDVLRFLQGGPADRAYDVVLADPPYPMTEVELAQCLQQLAAAWLAPQSLVVLERARRSPEPHWPSSWERVARRSYGETVLWFAQPIENPADCRDA